MAHLEPIAATLELTLLELGIQAQAHLRWRKGTHPTRQLRAVYNPVRNSGGKSSSCTRGRQ